MTNYPKIAENFMNDVYKSNSGYNDRIVIYFAIFMSFIVMTAIFSSILYLKIRKIVSKKKKTIVVSVDGNIGSGKSTLVEIIKKSISNYRTLKEPLVVWENVVDSEKGNIITKFYSDKQRWAYTFQNFAFITRMVQLYNVLQEQPQVIITERSPLTDKYVFATMLYHDGTMSEIEWEIYNYWYSYFNVKVDAIIYLNTDIEVCYKRINKRNRNGESDINLEYLAKLDKYHQNLISQCDNCIILDGNIEFENNKEISNMMVKQIKEFVERCHSSTGDVNSMIKREY